MYVIVPFFEGYFQCDSSIGSLEEALMRWAIITVAARVIRGHSPLLARLSANYAKSLPQRSSLLHRLAQPINSILRTLSLKKIVWANVH
jgi:hypothetical protein